MFPKAGPPYVVWDSDSMLRQPYFTRETKLIQHAAYHLWAMIGAYNYFLYSGEMELLEELWPKYEAGLDYALSLLNEENIVSVQGAKDWGRLTSTTERSSVSMLYVYYVSP